MQLLDTECLCVFIF